MKRKSREAKLRLEWPKENLLESNSCKLIPVTSSTSAAAPVISPSSLSTQQQQTLRTRSSYSQNENLSVVKLSNKNEPCQKFDRKRRNTESQRKLSFSNSISHSISSFSSSSSTDSNNTLLVDKYKPKSQKELSIPSKKSNEVREWMLKNSENKNLLILVGNPGIGKSTMCHVLANELNISLVSWKEGDSSSSSSFQNSGFAPGSTTATDSLEVMSRKQSPIDSFADFLSVCGSGVLELTIFSKGKEDDLKNNGNKIKRLCTSLKKNEKISNNEDSRSLILIEDIPYLHTKEAKDRFREILSTHIQTSNMQTILIYSNVDEGKANPGDIERLIFPSLLNPHVKIMKINNVTEATMKKILTNIYISEQQRASTTQQQQEWREFITSVYATSHGDLRNAINALQLFISVCKKTRFSFKKNMRNDDLSNHDNKRDMRFNPFHGLGKLLYAKRIDHDQNKENKNYDSLDALENLLKTSKKKTYRAPLTFNPETVIHNNALEIPTTLSFINYHSPSFYSDITELSNAFDYLSDAAFLSSKYQNIDTLYPMSYVASITSRTVAFTNRTPTKTKSFKQLASPHIFNISKKQKYNKMKITQLCKRLSMGSQIYLNPFFNNRDVTTIVKDCLPYWRLIIPSSEIQFVIEDLYSYAQSQGEDVFNNDDQDDLLHLELQEQRVILMEDDIEDID